jgi:hypothetical protein
MYINTYFSPLLFSEAFFDQGLFSMDDDIAGDSDCTLAENVVPEPSLIANLSRRHHGPLVVFLLIACVQTGFWVSETMSWDDTDIRSGQLSCLVLGRWATHDRHAPADEHASLLHSFATKLTRGISNGFVDYVVGDIVQLTAPLDIDLSLSHETIIRIFGESASQCIFNGVQQSFVHLLHSLRYPKTVVVKLAPTLVARLLSSRCSIFHSVAITQRFSFKRCLGTRPGKRVLHDMRAMNAAARPKQMMRAPQRKHFGRKSWTAVPVARVLRWVRSTRHIKDLSKHSVETGEAFCDILGEDSADLAQTLRASLKSKKVSATVIREARVRVDMVACKLWRDFFESLLQSVLAIYIYIDTSPQWRGLDMVAISFDLVCFHAGDTMHFSRRFPYLALEQGQFDVFGKLIALLWGIFLVAGPSYWAMRKFCDSVVSILTDAGTERGIIGSVDVSGSMLLFEQSPPLSPVLDKLLPNATASQPYVMSDVSALFVNVSAC